MGLINLPKANQTPNQGGCLRRIIVIAAIVFVAYYLMKSCGGGGVINYNPFDTNSTTATESTTTTTTNTGATTTTNTGTATSDYEDGAYSWIVGTWDCEMGAYGTVVMNFEGDGTTGRCSELQPNGTYRYGSYHVEGNVLSYKLTGESFSTTIDIEPGHKLAAGGGAYYRKRN